MKLKDAKKIQTELDKVMALVNKTVRTFKPGTKDKAECYINSLYSDVIKANGKSDEAVKALKTK